MNITRDDSGCDAAWVDRAVALLDESAQSLDAATLSRLSRARSKALAHRGGVRRGWVAGGGLMAAAAALVLAFGVLHHPAGPPVMADDPAAAEADPLASEDNLDLYENLDFYAWLDAQQQDTNG
jgi:hypothetical protein